MRKYTKEHEWLEIEGDVATIGITDHAQSELGDITFVELPEVGRTVTKGEAFAVVESVKAASDVYAPLAGEVVEVNPSLEDSPELINEAAEAGGWFAKVKLAADAAGDPDLLDRDGYDAFVKDLA